MIIITIFVNTLLGLLRKSALFSLEIEKSERFSGVKPKLP